MILIYSSYHSSRLQYTLDFVFGEVLGLKWELSTDIDAFEMFNEAKLNYSTEEIAKSFWLQPCGFLAEKGIHRNKPDVFKWNDLPVFFKTNEKSILPFDLFSMVFYLISRYEEYLPLVKYDMHGRYFAEQSLAFQYAFLEVPLLDVLLTHFKQLLKQQFPGLLFRKNEYKYIPTFDIDVLFAHKAKPYWRLIGGSLKNLLSLNFAEIRKRIDVVFYGKDDPFDNFDDLHLISGIDKPLAFLNVGDYGSFDKNNAMDHPLVIRALEKLQTKFDLGWHPSYQSNDNKKVLLNECKTFNKKIGFYPQRSRQHFIRLSFPFTYQDLIEAGIREDYSMGYPSHIGFRAGTAFPFYFYDLSNEEKTNLKIFPFTFMDGTLFDYMKLNKDEALVRLERISVLLQKTGGKMMGVWHNSFIADDTNKMEFYKKVKNKL